MSSVVQPRRGTANIGILSSEQEALAAVVDRLVTSLDPALIWLFGSRARGEARADSDFDLLVVARPTGGFDGDDYEAVYTPLKGLGVGVDVVPCDHETYQASLGLRTSFVRHVVDEGRLVYGGTS